MKKLFPYIIFVLVLISCETGTEKNIKQSAPGSKNYRETSPLVDYQAAIDSLSQLENELEVELELLKKKFDYKQQDLKGKSYYHKNWWGNYYISDQAILAGVDSVGNFFLIANVWTYSYINTNLDSIRVRIDTTNYYAASDTSFIEPLVIVCACGFHQTYFTDDAAQNIGRAISENPDKEIKWVGIKKLTKRDIVGIKESFELSEKLQAVFSIRKQIEELNQQLTK